MSQSFADFGNPATLARCRELQELEIYVSQSTIAELDLIHPSPPRASKDTTRSVALVPGVTGATPSQLDAAQPFSMSIGRPIGARPLTGCIA